MNRRVLRRKFSQQFKADVVTQMLRGASVDKLSEEHGIKTEVLYRWRNEAERVLKTELAGDASQQRKYQELKRELRELRKQQEVFKLGSGWED